MQPADRGSNPRDPNSLLLRQKPGEKIGLSLDSPVPSRSNENEKLVDSTQTSVSGFNFPDPQYLGVKERKRILAYFYSLAFQDILTKVDVERTIKALNATKKKNLLRQENFYGVPFFEMYTP